MPPSAAETTHSSGDALSGRAIKHCQFCPNPTADNATSYGVSYAELRESGEKGCAACAFICAGIAGVLGSDEPIIFNLWIVAQLPEATSAHTALSHSAARHSGAHSSAGGRCFIYLSLPGENKCIEIYTDDARVSQRLRYIPTKPHVPTQPWSSTSAQQARKWLESCLANHESCSRGYEVTALPTRVVAVGSSTQDLFLYESATGECGTYACLSYCWGKTWTFTTTVSTIQERKAGFGLDDLPKTLRDAVLVARSMSIQYIWIDQLCIIQDSQVDWQNQAAKMCSIYANADVTFAALDSPDTSTGLFVSSTKRALIGGAAVETFLPGLPAERKIYAREQLTPTRLGFMHDMGEQMRLFQAGGFLNSRLWTLQEAALSRRLLWFSSYEVGWSCLETRACECEPIPRTTVNCSSAFELPYWIKLVTGLRGELAMRNWLWMWAQIVTESTERMTTHQTDRLPAIAGLAAEMQKTIGIKYLAGLWERHLDVSLLWHCRDGQRDGASTEYSGRGEASPNVMSPVTQDYAPSWTWASVTGPIVMNAKYIEPTEAPLPLWRVLATEFSPTSLNIYGPGKGALTIQGILARLLPDFKDGSELVSFHFLQDSQANAINFQGISVSEWNLDRRNTSPEAQTIREKELHFAFAGFEYDEYEKTVRREGKGLLLEKVRFPDVSDRVARSSAAQKDNSGVSLPQDMPIKDDGYGNYRRIGILTVHADEKCFEDEAALDQWCCRAQKDSKIFHII